MRQFLLRLIGFVGAPILSALAPFLVLPVVSRALGDAGWGDFSAAQSIGILGMVGVLFGWSVVGPVNVARARDAAEKAVILRDSLRSRAVTALAAIPVAALIAAVLVTPDMRALAIAVVVATAAGGFTPAWFTIGEANPRALIMYDAAPKLVASGISMVLILLTGMVFWYPVALLLLTLPAFALHARSVLRALPAQAPRPPVTRILRTLLPTAGVDATGNAYGSTPVPIASAGLVASDSSGFASADRAYRIGTMGVVALGNAFQAWVLDRTAPDPARRQLIAFIGLSGLGAAGGALLAVVGPWATAVVFGSENSADPLVCLLYGVAFFFIAASTPLIRNMLVPAGKSHLVFVATACAGITGVTTMAVGAILRSAVVIAAGVAAAEAVTFVVLAGVVGLRIRSGHPVSEPVPRAS